MQDIDQKELNTLKTLEILKTQINGLQVEMSKTQNLIKQNIETLEFLTLITISNISEKLKKRNKRPRVRKQARDAMSPDDMAYLMKNLKTQVNLPLNKKDLLRIRAICAFSLLYLTGLREGNLKEFKVYHFKELRQQGWTNLNRIKGGREDERLIITEKGMVYLSQLDPYFNYLIKDKLDEDIFFSAQKSNKPLERTTFNKQLNNYLKLIFKDKGVNYRTHSFRIGFVNSLLKHLPIEQVQEFAGHQDIKTTQVYVRPDMSPQGAREALSQADEERFIL